MTPNKYYYILNLLLYNNDNRSDWKTVTLIFVLQSSLCRSTCDRGTKLQLVYIIIFKYGLLYIHISEIVQRVTHINPRTIGYLIFYIYSIFLSLVKSMIEMTKMFLYKSNCWSLQYLKLTSIREHEARGEMEANKAGK